MKLAAFALIAFFAAMPGCEEQRGPESGDGTSGVSVLEAPETIDLGDAARNVAIEFDIPVRNTSVFQSMRVSRVATSCGCTSATIDSDVIPPGGATTVHGVIQTAELASGQQVRVAIVGDSGVLSTSRVFIRSVDPLNPLEAIFSDGDMVIPVHALYDPDEYDWAAYRFRDDVRLPVRIEHDSERSATLHIQHAPDEGPVAVVFHRHGVHEMDQMSQIIDPDASPKVGDGGSLDAAVQSSR